MAESESFSRPGAVVSEDTAPLLAEDVDGSSQPYDAMAEDVEGNDYLSPTARVPLSIRILTAFSLVCSAMALLEMLVTYVIISLEKHHKFNSADFGATVLILGFLLLISLLINSGNINTLRKSSGAALQPLSFTNYLVEIPLSIFSFFIAGLVIETASSYGSRRHWSLAAAIFGMSGAILASISGIAQLLLISVRSIAAYYGKRWAGNIPKVSRLRISPWEFRVEFNVMLLKQDRAVQL